MVKWIVGCLAVAIVAFFLWPVVSPQPGPAFKTYAFSNIKQIGVATRLYAEDSDNFLPHATSMPTVRAQIGLYCKKDVWRGVPKTSTDPQFNFNIAGFNLSNGNQLGTNQSPSEVSTPTFYSILTKTNNQNNVIRASIGGNTKAIPLSQLLDELSIQVERNPDSLAPSSYLSDQDPYQN